jgi:hypothetical protein
MFLSLALVAPVNNEIGLLAMLLYIGPDVLMPLLSGLAAALGVVMMFWRRVIGFVGSLFRRLSGRGPAAASERKDEPAR